MSELENKLKQLRDKSGVYLMKDAEGKIIYVGKAKVLKNRVKQYFTGTQKYAKVAAMVGKIGQFQTLTQSRVNSTASEKTAPTERSIPPEMTTIARPRVTRPNSAICRPRSERLERAKKSGVMAPKTAMMMINARKGIALSIQDLDSNSPIR